MTQVSYPEGVKLTVVTFGKYKHRSLAGVEEDYLKRMRGISVHVVELKLAPSSLSEIEAMRWEAKLLKPYLDCGAFTVALDERGETVSSKDLSRFISKQQEGAKDIVFIIGGPYGIAEDVKKSAKKTISLSNLTFPYQLARIILIEQIYRAMTIMRGIPYHKE